MPFDIKVSSANAIAGLLFMQAGMVAFDTMSTLNSSPWTSENFGADTAKAASAREYVWHSIAWSSFYCLIAAVISKSWWPIIGMVLPNAYLYWLYNRALGRAQSSGSTSWQSA